MDCPIALICGYRGLLIGKYYWLSSFKLNLDELRIDMGRVFIQYLAVVISSEPKFQVSRWQVGKMEALLPFSSRTLDAAGSLTLKSLSFYTTNTTGIVVLNSHNNVAAQEPHEVRMIEKR